MSSGRIIAVYIVIGALVFAYWLLFVGLGDREGKLVAFFYGFPCIGGLLIFGICLYLLSPVKLKSKHEFVCPKCKYNMRGLSEAKCPECGAVFTLDQLKLK